VNQTKVVTVHWTRVMSDKPHARGFGVAGGRAQKKLKLHEKLQSHAKNETGQTLGFGKFFAAANALNANSFLCIMEMVECLKSSKREMRG
jgi:hypothetical protein